KGRFGDFGGRFVPELLMTALQQSEKAYEEAIQDDGLKEELHDYLTQYVGRTTPLYEAKNLAKHLGSGRIFLKREDLIIQVHIELIIRLGKHFWQREWGKGKLSLKLVQVNMVLLQLQF